MNLIITKEVRNLVETAEKLAADASNATSQLPLERSQEFLVVVARGGQLITKLYGADSHYFALFQATIAPSLSSKYTSLGNIHSNHYRHVSEIAGILKAVESDINSGMLSNFKSLAQQEVFADFLGMAEHLLGGGYKDAAAVILGAVLEDSLRKIAEASDISVVSSEGKPLTLEPLNISVTKKGVYGPLVQKQITSWANLRNDAAHGHFDKYDGEQVKHMLLFVQKFCADYLK